MYDRAFYDPQDDYFPEHQRQGSPPLEAIKTAYTTEAPAESPSPSPPRRRHEQLGEAILIKAFAPNHPELAKHGRDPLDPSSEESTPHHSPEMVDIYDAEEHLGPKDKAPDNNVPAPSTFLPWKTTAANDGSTSSSQPFDAKVLEEQAAAAMCATEANSAASDQQMLDVPPRPRVDSAQEPSVDAARSNEEGMKSGHHTPLRLPTSDPTFRPIFRDDGSFRASRNRQDLFQGEGGSDVLPALQTDTSRRQSDGSSPRQQRLPSIRQHLEATGHLQLDRLPEATHQQNHMYPLSRHHSHSLSSANSPTSSYANHTMVQSSPASTSHYSPQGLPFPSGVTPINSHSPTSSTTDSSYRSTTNAAKSIFFADRRRSSPAAERSPTGSMSVHSASPHSVGGHSALSPFTDGPGMQHPSTSDASLALESAPRPSLPQLQGESTGVYRCNVPDCRAPVFQTQYLLNSHSNVHSQLRPFYCPDPGCERSREGNGFKRKNEMIRHGLVHKSPGYVCPFCADRLYRYPRPDNLLRHVNARHVGIDRDDPLLTEVLARRSEGGVKARRRRTITSGGGVSSNSNNIGGDGINGGIAREGQNDVLGENERNTSTENAASTQ